MGKMYRIFVKYATLKEDTENQLILTGRVVKKEELISKIKEQM